MPITISEKALHDYLKRKSLDLAILEEIKGIAATSATELDAAAIEELSEIVRSGKAREHFSIRDTVTLGGVDYEIIGFDHDKANSITFMQKTLTISRRMHGGALQKGWIDAELRGWLNNEYIEQLPAELVQHICAVDKITHNSNGEAFTTEDKLFIPSESELFGSAIWAACEEGARYEAFDTSENRIRLDEDGDSVWYWSRSAYGGNSTDCAYVSSNGTAYNNSASCTSIRVPVCFSFA